VSGQVILYQSERAVAPVGAVNVWASVESPLVGVAAPAIPDDAPECAVVLLAVVPVLVQPASPLSNWYIQKTTGQSSRIRRIMLIALARKLAISLWRYVETGLVPEGVVNARAESRCALA